MPFIASVRGNLGPQGKTPIIGTQSNPAASVAALYNAGIRQDAFYWIVINGTVTNVFCWLSGSEGWMLAMRLNSGSTTFQYSSSYWTDAVSLNQTQGPTSSLDIKNGFIWQNYTLSSFRMTGSSTSTAYTSNPLTFSGFSNTLFSMFNSPNNSFTTQIELGRTGWLNWYSAVTGRNGVNDFSTQPNCNQDGINTNYVYAGARIGWSGNNEADCLTNDSAIGFGLNTNNNANVTGAGGITWNPTSVYSTNGWLWIR